MLRVTVQSLGMKTPFRSQARITVTVCSQMQSTQYFALSSVTSINHVFCFQNLPRPQKCVIEVYQLINKQDRLCGTVCLNRDELAVQGKTAKRVEGCPDNEAVLVLAIEGEIGDFNEEDTDTSLKPIIQMLSGRLYKEERRGVGIGVGNYRETERFHARYKKLINNLDKELKEVRQTSQHKIKTLELDLKDTSRLHNKQITKLKQQIFHYRQKEQNKRDLSVQTSTIQTLDSYSQTLTISFDRSVQTEFVKFAAQPITFVSQLQQTDTYSNSKAAEKTITTNISCQMDQTHIELQEQIETLTTQLEDERERSAILAVQLQNLKQKIRINQTIKQEELKNELQHVRVHLKIQFLEEKGKYEKTIQTLQERVKSYEAEMQTIQEDQMKDLEDQLGEEIQRIKLAVFQQTLQKKTNTVEKVDAEVECQIIDDERNKFLGDLFEQNSRLAAHLEEVSANNYKQSVIIEELESELLITASIARQIEAEKLKVEQQLASLKHEHDAFIELNQKMLEQRQVMLKTISKFEQQGKELCGFAKNIGKKMQSKEDTILERSGEKQRSIISRKSRINPNRKLSQIRVQHNQQQQQNILNIPRQQYTKRNILQIPSLQLQRKNSINSSQQAAGNEFLPEIQSRSLREDYVEQSDLLVSSPEDNENNQMLIQSVINSDSNKSADPADQIKQSLLALHRQCEEQREEIDNLNFELDLQQEKILNYESTMANLEAERDQMRSAYEGIIEDLRKDLNFVNQEKDALISKCQQLQLEKQSIKTEFQKQLEQTIRQNCQKQNHILNEHAQVIGSFKQQLQQMLADMEKRNEQSIEQKQLLERKVDQLQQVIEHIREELDQKDDQFDQRNDQYLSELENACRQVEQVQEILAQRQKQCLDLSQQVAILQQKNIQLENREKRYAQMLQQRDIRIEELLNTQNNSQRSDDSVEKQHAQTQTEKDDIPMRNRRRSLGIRPAQQDNTRKRKVSEQISIQEFPLSIQESEQISNILSDGIGQSLIPQNHRLPHFKQDKVKELEEKILQLQHTVKEVQTERDEIATQAHQTLEYYEQQHTTMKQMLKIVEKKLQASTQQFKHCLEHKNQEIEQIKAASAEQEENLIHSYQNQLHDQTKQHHSKVKSLEQSIVKTTIQSLRLQHQLSSKKHSLEALEQKFRKLELQYRTLKIESSTLKISVQSYQTKFKWEVIERQEKVSRLITVIKEEFYKQLQFEKQLMNIQNKINFGTPIATHRLLHQDQTNTSQQAILEEMGKQNKVNAETQISQKGIVNVQDLKRLQEILKLKDQQLKSLMQQINIMKIEQEAIRKSFDERSNMYRKRLSKLLAENLQHKSDIKNIQINSEKEFFQKELIQELISQDIPKS